MNTHFEVEVMGTRLITLTFYRSAVKQPKIQPGHPSFPTTKLQRYNLYQNLSPPDSELLDGLRGAPIVGGYSNDLAGLMDIAAGDCPECGIGQSNWQRLGCFLRANDT